MEILVTPRMKVTVSGKGDSSLLQPKAWVTSESIVMANRELFGRKFTVHMGNAPPPQAKPDPNASEVYHISGQVVAVNESGLTVNFGNAGGTQKVTYEEGATVEVLVSSTDHDLIAEGAKIELEGQTRGTKFLPSRLSVELDKPITLDDIQAASNDKKGSRSKSASTTRGSRKTGKSKADEPAGDPIGEAADPFGVLGKKNGSGKKPDSGKKKPAETPDDA